MPERTLKEIAQLANTDPTALTRKEIDWLRRETNRAKGKRDQTSEPGYDVIKERSRKIQADKSVIGRDINELPAVADPKRRKRCEKSFKLFCETYFAATFYLPWSDDQLTVIKKIQQSVVAGGLFALGMPRGSGKTSLCERGALWGVVTGRRRFVALIGAEASLAEEMLDTLKMEIETNELLAADFPEICYPIRCLEGIAQRANGQLYKGARTHIGWTATEIILPTIPGSIASGVIIRVAGITGRIRGMKYLTRDGETIRPDIALVDDPQTDDSSASLSQNTKRRKILAGAILGLAGPDKKIAGFMPCTVINKEDMADQILSRDKYPQWQGERMKMVYAFPTNDKLWVEYEEIRALELKAGRDITKATQFYRKNRKAMDVGAVVAWKHRKNPDEISALQHAMNLKFDDEDAFLAEYQGEPREEQEENAALPADQIAAKVNSHKRGVVPIGVTRMTAFIDVQKKILLWTVCGWDDDFTGYVVGYGAWPDPQRSYYSLRDIRKTLARAIPGSGLEGSIYGGLEKLTAILLGREWKREGGSVLRVERCLVDANWGLSTDVVYQFCRQSQYASALMPSHGRYVGASGVPMSDYKKKPGERVGHNWRIPTVRGKRAVRHVLFDANYWKSFVHARFAINMGDKGCLSLFGSKAITHRLYSEHLTAEYCIPTEAKGRTIDEWHLKPSKPDNHWLDTTVGCAVAASMCGIALESQQRVRRGNRKRVSFAEMKRKKQNGSTVT